MKVSLHTSALAAHAHEAVVLPWLQDAARKAAGNPQPTVVLVPLRADAYYLKGRALQMGINLLGVHFLTPSDARDRLAAHGGLQLAVPLREHLHLLLATAAERVRERRDDQALASVAASPDQLLKAVDLIGGGGWNFSEAGPARLRPVVAEFQSLLESAGFCLMHDADRALLQTMPSASPLFGTLLVTGFNALHWPLWPLLEAAVRNSESAAVCLTDPRLEAEALDAAWIGTWEQAFGAAQPVQIDLPPSPLADLTQPNATQSDRSQSAQVVQFLVGEDTAEQARAVVTQALQFLSLPSCERLGILFPSSGALSRRVADLLAELDVPHHDGLPHQAPGPLEDVAWPAWLALQESPRLPALLQFLEARADESFAGLPVPEAVQELQHVFQELLIDDLSVVAEYLSHHSGRQQAPALAEALQELPILPERAPLAEFLQRSDRLFRSLGWTARADELQRLAIDWRNALTLVLSRRTWLRWLGETLVSWRVTRADAGRHPYSRLHLLPYAQAESQAWTHLIATGLNEGEWPPAFEDAGLLDEEETDALNRRLRALNDRVTAQGRQGEGHIAVQSGKAFCLGPAERRALAARQFYNTLESVTAALAVSAQLHDEDAPDRLFNPGQFFFQIHFSARGAVAGHDTMIALRARTAEWLRRSANGKPAPKPEEPIARQTRRAYDARRAPDAPFGEYEFALKLPPKPPLRLAAKRWEDALAAPAQVWFQAVLGVGPDSREEETPWALAQGNWVHDWMRALAEGSTPHEFIPLPAPAELHTRVRTAAAAFRDRVAASFVRPGRPLPEWWTSSWEQALGVAAALAEAVARVDGRTHAAAEWKLGETALPVEGGALHIRGRIDLLLTTAASLEDAWLVDYKTGQRKPLRVRDLEGGDGIQLALYALALRAAGAREVGLSLLTPGAPLDRPQLMLADLDSLGSLWRGLLHMQETGIFGMYGALRQEYGHRGDYPLATLGIDEEILAEKWVLTHPDLSPAEEES